MLYAISEYEHIDKSQEQKRIAICWMCIYKDSSEYSCTNRNTTWTPEYI